MKIVKSPYLSKKSSDFDEIWYTASDIEPGYSHVTKNCNSEIHDGGGRHLENRYFGHYSLINRLSDFSKILYDEAERHVDKKAT